MLTRSDRIRLGLLAQRIEAAIRQSVTILDGYDIDDDDGDTLIDLDHAVGKIEEGHQEMIEALGLDQE